MGDDQATRIANGGGDEAPTGGKTIVYIADPMCSWCWGFAPVIAAIDDAFGAAPPVRLADDRWSRQAALVGGLERTLRQRLEGPRPPGNTTLDRH